MDPSGQGLVGEQLLELAETIIRIGIFTLHSKTPPTCSSIFDILSMSTDFLLSEQTDDTLDPNCQISCAHLPFYQVFDLRQLASSLRHRTYCY